MSKDKKPKIVIDWNGNLMLNRAGKPIHQSCPFTNFEENCGDGCAKFDGPFFDLQENLVTIDICGTEIYCKLDEFEDRRENGKG